MSPEHIALLLIEDNAGDARLIQEILATSRHARFTLTRVARLDEALAALKTDVFDAALLDLTLPDSRGIETFRRLHRAAPSLPVVIMTGVDGEDAGVRAVKEGAQDYLVKGEPASEALIRTVRHAIERQLSSFELRESEQNYRRLFDAVADPIVVIDPNNGEIVDINLVAETLYGYAKDEVIGKQGITLSAEPLASAAALVTLRTSDSELFHMRRHRRKDGRIFPVEVHSSALVLKGRRLAINAIRDITAREEAREQLAQEKQRLIEAQAVAKVGSWDTDLANMTVLWSAETHRIFETDPDTFAPTHAAFLTLVHPADRAGVDAAFMASSEKSGRHSIEHRIVLPDGRIKFVEERWQIHAAAGERRRAVGTCQDITERVVAQRLIEQSHRRFKQMADSISQVFWMSDLEKKKMIYINPAYETIWGRSCDELYRNPGAWLDAVLPEDRERVLAALPRQLDGSYDEQYRISRPDGEIRWIRDRAYPVRDEDGCVHQVAGVAQDVTEQVLAEAAMHVSQEFLEKAQEVANTGSWVNPLNDRDELIWSKQCRHIFGVELDRALVFADLIALIHPDDRPALAAAREKAIRDGAPYTMEYRIIRPDGAERTLRTKAEVIRDKADGTQKLIGVVSDVTDRKESERRLKETEAMLAQAQKMESMGRLAGGVAHDFNNILTAILGLSELSILTLPKENPLRADLEEIRAAGLRAANLTQQLLAFSRRQVTSPRLIELDATVAGLAKMLRRIIGEHVELVIEPGAAGTIIKADPGQIEQLVMNLSVNARDAMPKGGTITIRTGVEDLGAEAAADAGVPAGRYVNMSVQDTGAGMSLETQNRLFEPFFTTKEKGKGTGLGLSTCYGVVKQSGGAIRCVSAPGAGTTFRVLLPSTTGKPSAGSAAAPSQLPHGGETILLVEDEEAVRRLTSRILRGLGYAVLEAADGEQGLALLENDQKGAVRLLLTDMVMPKMSGWDLAERAGAVRPGISVLFVSGYTDDTFDGMCALDDRTDILAKPFTAEVLAARVRRALDADGKPPAR